MSIKQNKQCNIRKREISNITVKHHINICNIFGPQVPALSLSTTFNRKKISAFKLLARLWDHYYLENNQIRLLRHTWSPINTFLILASLVMDILLHTLAITNRLDCMRLFLLFNTLNKRLLLLKFRSSPTLPTEIRAWFGLQKA